MRTRRFLRTRSKGPSRHQTSEKRDELTPSRVHPREGPRLGGQTVTGYNLV
jgi:hypothetical protein